MENIKCAMISLKSVKASTWIRLVVLITVMLNVSLNVFGISAVDIGNETLEKVATVVLACITALDCYWKNNSFSMAAQTADEIMKTLKR